jgi:carboxymethylenebutenolidase
MVEALWGDGAPTKGFLARPEAGAPRAGIVVCAGEDGATEFLRGVTRRLAKDGYAGLLVDPLSRGGGTAAVPVAARAAIQTAHGAAAERHAELQGAAIYLAEEGGVETERIGLLGFGFGGKVAWDAAQSRYAPVGRALVVYGTRPASLTDADRLPAAVQAHYGALDWRALADLPALEGRLRGAGGDYDLRVHAGAGREFWEAAAAGAAAEAAWRATLRWFDVHLVQRPAAASSAAPPTRMRPN